MSPTGSFVANGDAGGNIFIWEREGGGRTHIAVQAFTGTDHQIAVNWLQFNAGGDCLLASSSRFDRTAASGSKPCGVVLVIKLKHITSGGIKATVERLQCEVRYMLY